MAGLLSIASKDSRQLEKHTDLVFKESESEFMIYEL